MNSTSFGVYTSGYQGNFNPNYPLVIPSGQVNSGVVTTGGFTLCGLQTPPTFEGAALTFLVSLDGVTYTTLNTAGSPYSVTVAVSEYVALNYVLFLGAAFIKVVSGTTVAANRTLICSLKGF